MGTDHDLDNFYPVWVKNDWPESEGIESLVLNCFIKFVSVRQLHREFLRAGSDVMQTFTFNGTEGSIVSHGVSIKVSKNVCFDHLVRKVNEHACSLTYWPKLGVIRQS